MTCKCGLANLSRRLLYRKLSTDKIVTLSLAGSANMTFNCVKGSHSVAVELPPRTLQVCHEAFLTLCSCVCSQQLLRRALHCLTVAKHCSSCITLLQLVSSTIAQMFVYFAAASIIHRCPAKTFRAALLSDCAVSVQNCMNMHFLRI